MREVIDTASPAPRPDPPATAGSFGTQLRRWRVERRCSQLALALEAGVSQRHLSCLERDRARPSPAMVLRLADALQLPLRARNPLLLAAGHAPMYAARTLDDAAMAAVRQALHAVLQAHEPRPGFVVDRHWNLVLHNTAFDRVIALCGEPAVVWARVDPGGRRNLLRLCLHPQGLRPLLADAPMVETLLLDRLRHECRAAPDDAVLQQLHAELRADAARPVAMAAPSVAPPATDDTPPLPTLNLRLQTDDGILAFFTLVCRLGTALDLTADELRLELLFPADAPTAGRIGAAQAGFTVSPAAPPPGAPAAAAPPTPA